MHLATLCDLQRKLAESKLAEASYDFTLPMKTPLSRFVVSDFPQKLLQPHATFSIMYHTYPDEFRARFLGNPGEIEKFWSGLEGSPLLQEFPFATDRKWAEKAVPIAIHGDGTPIAGLGKAWGKMLDLYVFTSLLCNAVAKARCGPRSRSGGSLPPSSPRCIAELNLESPGARKFQSPPTQTTASLLSLYLSKSSASCRPILSRCSFVRPWL